MRNRSARWITCLWLAITAALASAGPAVSASPQDAYVSANRAFREGAWDDAIQHATPGIEALESGGQRDPALLLRLRAIRGLSASQISWFGLAEQDLAPLAPVAAQSGENDVTTVLNRIARLKPLVPPQVQEIRDDDRVIFRVYFEANDRFTRGVIQSLATAYDANHRLTGFELTETPVFIFSTGSNFDAFYTAFVGKPPSATLAGVAINGAILVPPPLPGTRLGENPTAEDFNSLTVHEFNHCILRRVWGRGRPPKWFVEGLATVAEAYASQRESQLLERRFQRARAADALLYPEQIKQDRFFEHASEVGSLTNVRGGQGPDPYAQAYHMTVFLLKSLEEDQILPFLTSLRSMRFSDALVQYAGGTEDQFFQAWMDHVKAQ